MNSCGGFVEVPVEIADCRIKLAKCNFNIWHKLDPFVEILISLFIILTMILKEINCGY
jgi:hypothetical protein